MSANLSEAQQGDTFRAPYRERTYEAHIMDLNGDLWAVVDYSPVFRISDIPAVWARLDWEKVQ